MGNDRMKQIELSSDFTIETGKEYGYWILVSIQKKFNLTHPRYDSVVKFMKEKYDIEIDVQSKFPADGLPDGAEYWWTVKGHNKPTRKYVFKEAKNDG